MIGALVAFALCAAVGPAVAPIQAAESSLADANFDEALRQLDRLVADRRATPLHGRAQLLRAQCLNAKGDSPGTERALAAALESDPESRLDPHAVSPLLVSQLEALRQRARADVRIKADRPDAVVRLGDRELGTTPLKLQLPIGRHRLQARTRDGRFAASQEVLLFPNRVHELSLSLEVAGGIRAEPAQPERRPPEPSSRAEPQPERAEENREASRAASPAASSPGSYFYGGGSLGEGHGIFLAEIGWPALQLSYLRGATDRVDLGGLFAFTYGFEGIAGIPSVPGVRLGGLLRVRLYDGPKLNFGLRLSPAMVLHFFPDNTVFGFAVPLELAAAMPMTSQVAFHFGLGVPLALFYAEGALAILSFLPGAGIEYRPVSGLTVALDMKLGPAFQLSGDQSAGLQFHMALGLGFHF